MTTKVTTAINGPAELSSSRPAGASLIMAKQIGKTVTAISIMMVPPTVGVMILRKALRRWANANCINAETMTSVASNGTPPASTASMEMAMKAPEVPMNST
jgi:hypothetical protein